MTALTTLVMLISTVLENIRKMITPAQKRRVLKVCL